MMLQRRSARILLPSAFATAYHSHVCEVCDPDDHDTDSPMGFPATTREFQERASEEEPLTTDDDAMDSAGPTCVPNSPAARHDQERTRIPSEQARNAAAAVMRTNFPSMLAEMNPDWDPLTEQDLLHRSEDTSDSAEAPSEECWISDDSDSEIGLHIALTRITKSELVQAQQSTPHYLCQLKIVGSGEVHVV